MTAWKKFHQMAFQLTDGALMSVKTQDVLNVAEAFIVLLSFSVIDVSHNLIRRKIAATL